jgi:hypothetical protein
MVRTCERPWKRAACGEPCHQWTYLQEYVSDLLQGVEVRWGKAQRQSRDDVQREGGGDNQRGCDGNTKALHRRCKRCSVCG